MKIQFKKGGQKQSILTCIREDGTSTWAKLKPGMETHNLAHYAVETVLKFDKAFYGILSSGYGISDFELPAHKKPKELASELDESAIQTEHIVNLLQIEVFNIGENQQFIPDLISILKENNLPVPHNLNTSTLTKIREMFSGLLVQWQSLENEGVLELDF